jgi:hypothetical protein
MNGMFAIITLVAVAVAVSMTVIVLRMVWQERLRSEARVAALAKDIHASGAPDVRTSAPSELDIDEYRAPAEHHAPIAMAEMFAPAQETTSRRWMLGPGVLGLATAVAILLAMGLSSGRTESAESQSPARPSPATAGTAVPQPLELLALEHERQDDHLTVRGVVRNPAHSTEVDHLTAVVLLFNRQGGFLTSGRAAVESPALLAGSETPFAITVPGAADVGRYRVSFRTDEQVVPHVDRRHIQG